MDVTNVDDDDIAVYRPVGGKEDSQLLDRHAPLQFGVFENQPYIQVASSYSMDTGSDLQHQQPIVAWAPYLMSSPSRTPLLNFGSGEARSEKSDVIAVRTSGELTRNHLHTHYPYDIGLLLQTCNVASLDESTPTESPSHQADSIFDHLEEFGANVSLSYYWKEVTAISVTFAILLNVILWLTRSYRHRLAHQISGFSPPTEQDGDDDVKEADDTNSKSADDKVSQVSSRPESYTSRYLSDFTHIQCLGKGGFGVVFHSRNNLDECEYAVKRVTLPNRLDAKEKVTREVKALAKLDHPNIVRYFQSWLETPPAGWQEEYDREWNSTEKFLPTPVNSVTGETSGQSHNHPIFHLDMNSFTDSSLIGPKPHDDSLDIVFDESSMPVSHTGGHKPFRTYRTSHHKISDVPPSDEPPSSSGDSAFHNNDTTSEMGSTQSFEVEHSVPRKDRDPYSDKQSLTSPRTNLFLYIQMQLCRRETLREYLNANTLHRDRASILDMFQQICDAVQYIHQHDLIHRDLKPTNIFFSLENTIKVGDFGLVAALSGDQSESAVTAAKTDCSPQTAIQLTENVGTQLYMSPEQATGGSYDHKVDIFSLGMVFFEMKYPFSTAMERVDVLQLLRRGQLPKRFSRELPLESVLILAMVSHKPHRRPSIKEVISHPVLSS